MPDQIPGSVLVYSGNPANLPVRGNGARVSLMDQEGNLTPEERGTWDPPSSGSSWSGLERRRRGARCNVDQQRRGLAPPPASHVTTVQVSPCGRLLQTRQLYLSFGQSRPFAPRGGDCAASQLSTPTSLRGGLGRGPRPPLLERPSAQPSPLFWEELGQTETGCLPSPSIRRTSRAALHPRKRGPSDR